MENNLAISHLIRLSLIVVLVTVPEAIGEAPRKAVRINNSGASKVKDGDLKGKPVPTVASSRPALNSSEVRTVHKNVLVKKSKSKTGRNKQKLRPVRVDKPVEIDVPYRGDFGGSPYE